MNHGSWLRLKPVSRLQMVLFVVAGTLLAFVPDEVRAVNLLGPFGGNEPTLSNEDSDQIIKMLETFQAGCTYGGRTTDDAIALVKGLTKSLEAAKDPQCESVAGVMARMQAAQIRAEGFTPYIHEDMYNSIDKEVSGYQSQKERVLFLLSQTADPAEIAILKDELRAAELNLARVQGEQKAIKYNDRRQRQARALQELVIATNESMDQVLANQSCWINKPNLLRELGGVAVGVGGSVAMATPASETAMLIGAGVQMVAKVIDFFEKFRVRKQIAEFNFTLAPTALTCALERMNEIYCSARDTLRAVDTAGKNIHGDDPVWHGVKLLDEDMPEALTWLEQLRAGGGGGTPDEAATRLSLAKQEAMLNESQQYAYAYMDQQQKSYDLLKDPELKYQLIRSTAISLANNYPMCPDPSMGGSENPMCDVKSSDVGPFFLMGITPDERINLGVPFQGRVFKLAEVELSYFAMAKVTLRATFPLMRAQFDEWHRQAKERFEIKKSLVVGGDLYLTFNKAMPTESQKGAFVSLKKLLDFAQLEVTNVKNSKPLARSHQDLRARVVAALTEIVSQIEAVDTGKTTPDKGKEAILKVFRLDRGTSDLRDYLVRLISIQLDWLVYASGDVPNDLAIQWLASTDYLQELRQFSGQDSSLEEIALRAEESQRVVRTVLPTFFKAFKAPLYRALLGMTQKEAQGPKTVLCFQLLMSDSHGQYFPYDTCDGLIGRARTERGVSTPAFSEGLFAKRFADRACLYRDFIRKNKVLQREGRLPGDSRLRRPVSDFFAQPVWRILLQRSVERQVVAP